VSKQARTSRKGTIETVTLVPQKGKVIVLHRNSRDGRFTSERSASRIRATSMKAADSLKRLAKR